MLPVAVHREEVEDAIIERIEERLEGIDALRATTADGVDIVTALAVDERGNAAPPMMVLR